MKNVFAVIIFLFSINAAAVGFYVEPGVTYEHGDNSFDWPSPLSSSTGTTDGLGLNLKLGMGFADIFFVGVDGSYSKPKFKNSANNYDANATSSLLGVSLGMQMPIAGLRGWVGYTFDGTLDPEESGGVDVKFTGANGFKLGVGFHISIVSLNLEYLDLSYKNSDLEKAGPVSGTLSNELKNKLWVFSVSFPFLF